MFYHSFWLSSPLSMEYQVTLLPGMVKELDYTSLWPVVSNGPSLPVEHNGCVCDGEEVGTRVVDLHSTLVLQQGHLEVVCRGGERRIREEERERKNVEGKLF